MGTYGKDCKYDIVKEIFSEVMDMDKLQMSLIGAGLLSLSQLINSSNLTVNSCRNNTEGEQTGNVPFSMQPGMELSDFTSNKYNISFKYPKEWSKNPRYEDKYEGTNGFFEVGDFSGIGDTIDAAVKDQIDEDYKPYGSNPVVRSFVVDGEPARVIYPSSDQQAFYRDRDIAIVVQYPRPIMVDGQQYDYVVIWTNRENVSLILSTLKFTS